MSLFLYVDVFLTFLVLTTTPFNADRCQDVQIRNQKVGGSIPPVSTKKSRSWSESTAGCLVFWSTCSHHAGKFGQSRTTRPSPNPVQQPPGRKHRGGQHERVRVQALLGAPSLITTQICSRAPATWQGRAQLRLDERSTSWQHRPPPPLRQRIPSVSEKLWPERVQCWHTLGGRGGIARLSSRRGQG